MSGSDNTINSVGNILKVYRSNASAGRLILEYKRNRIQRNNLTTRCIFVTITVVLWEKATNSDSRKMNNKITGEQSLLKTMRLTRV